MSDTYDHLVKEDIDNGISQLPGSEEKQERRPQMMTKYSDWLRPWLPFQKSSSRRWPKP